MNNLKKFRTEYGISQRELAAKVGIGRSLIAQLEVGGCRMTYRIAIKLSEFFHCYPYEILGDDVIDIHGGFLESIKALVDFNAVNMIQQLQSGHFDRKEQLLYSILLKIVDMNEEQLTNVLLMLGDKK